VTAVLSHVLPDEYSASAIGLVFLGSTYWLCLRADRAEFFGLSLGGVFERSPLRPERMLRETLRALGIALGVSALVFPLFYIGFVFWHEPKAGFSLARAGAGLGGGAPFGWLDVTLGHVLAVALPEEAFFRGYLQSSLAQAESEKREAPSWTGALKRHGPAIFISSVIFALGHVLTVPHPARLAVFFPSLAFGALRAQTGGIGASVFFHALCNLYSAALFAGFGL
jgi:uncharacterized protein